MSYCRELLLGTDMICEIFLVIVKFATYSLIMGTINKQKLLNYAFNMEISINIFNT